MDLWEGLWRRKSFDALRRHAEKPDLKRSLGPWDLTALGIGSIVGTGIFVLPGVVASRYAGPGLVLSFLIAGTGAALAALVYAELAALVPVSGSVYTYSYAALGEIVAWVIGWDLILEYVVAAAAVALGWSSYLTDLLAGWGIRLPEALRAGPAAGGWVNLPAVAIVALATLLVIRGARESATLNAAVVVVKLAVLGLFLGVGAPRVDPGLWTPFLPFGLAGAAAGAAVIFFAFIGFDAVSTAAEEARRPERDLPIGILASLGIATLLYLAVAVVLTGLLPYRELGTASPVASALLAHGVRWASGLVAAGALAGLTSVLIVQLFGQSRIFFSMSRDGLLPPLFARLHPRLRTPMAGTLATGGAVAAIAGLLPIQTVAELANIGTLTAFVLVSAGVIALRYREPDRPRPFRVPGMPATPLLSIAFSLYLALQLPLLTWVRFLAWLAIGLAVYFGYARRHSLAGREQEGDGDPYEGGADPYGEGEAPPAERRGARRGGRLAPQFRPK